MVFAQVGIIDGPIVREGIAFGVAGSARGSVFFEENIPKINTTVPDATYLAWFDFSRLEISDPYKYLLKHAKIALNDGTTFGTGGKGFVRFNFGTSRSLVAEGLERIKKAIDEYEPE